VSVSGKNPRSSSMQGKTANNWAKSDLSLWNRKKDDALAI
jgi:hypothetical protein